MILTLTDCPNAQKQSVIGFVWKKNRLLPEIEKHIQCNYGERKQESKYSLFTGQAFNYWYIQKV